MRRLKISFEYILLVSFLLGILIAHLIPWRVEPFVIVSRYLVRIFLFTAPLIIFIVLLNSTSSLLGERRVSGKLIRISLILYATLVIASSIFASFTLSFFFLQYRGSGEFKSETYSYVLNTMIGSLLRPVSIAIFLGVILPYLFSCANKFDWLEQISRSLYEIQNRVLKVLLKIFPLISASLGASLYSYIGRLALNAYLLSFLSIFLLGLIVVTVLFILVVKITSLKVRPLVKYSFRSFVAGLATGSSYIALPLNLRIIEEHFNLNRSIKDFVITLGASLNRCGSVMGVLAVTIVSAHFNNIEILPQQVILLALPIALVGFGSPGIHGGTLLVTLPLVLHVVGSSNLDKFTATALALFVGGTTYVQAAINLLTSGYVALLVDHLTEKRSGLKN